MGVFSWIRTQVRNAVLGGFADAAAELTGTNNVPALLLEHRGPDAADDQDDPAPATGGQLPAPRNGRRAKV